MCISPYNNVAVNDICWSILCQHVLQSVNGAYHICRSELCLKRIKEILLIMKMSMQKFEKLENFLCDKSSDKMISKEFLNSEDREIMPQVSVLLSQDLCGKSFTYQKLNRFSFDCFNKCSKLNFMHPSTIQSENSLDCLSDVKVSDVCELTRTTESTQKPNCNNSHLPLETTKSTEEFNFSKDQSYLPLPTNVSTQESNYSSGQCYLPLETDTSTEEFNFNTGQCYLQSNQPISANLTSFHGDLQHINTDYQVVCTNYDNLVMDCSPIIDRNQYLYTNNQVYNFNTNRNFIGFYANHTDVQPAQFNACNNLNSNGYENIATNCQNINVSCPNIIQYQNISPDYLEFTGNHQYFVNNVYQDVLCFSDNAYEYDSMDRFKEQVDQNYLEKSDFNCVDSNISGECVENVNNDNESLLLDIDRIDPNLMIEDIELEDGNNELLEVDNKCVKELDHFTDKDHDRENRNTSNITGSVTSDIELVHGIDRLTIANEEYVSRGSLDNDISSLTFVPLIDNNCNENREFHHNSDSKFYDHNNIDVKNNNNSTVINNNTWSSINPELSVNINVEEELSSSIFDEQQNQKTELNSKNTDTTVENFHNCNVNKIILKNSTMCRYESWAACVRAHNVDKSDTTVASSCALISSCDRHEKAKKLRQSIIDKRVMKNRDQNLKIESIRRYKQTKADRQRYLWESKISRALQRRQMHLSEIVRRARDEEEKAREIAFINSIEAQNKRIDLSEQIQVNEARLIYLQQQRVKRHEQKAAQLEAVTQKRRANWELRRRELCNRHRDKLQEVDLRLQYQQMSRELTAHKRQQDREMRLHALQKTKQRNAEILQRRIEQKRQQSERRHDESLRQIRLRARANARPATQTRKQAQCISPEVCVDSDWQVSRQRKSHKNTSDTNLSDGVANGSRATASLIMSAASDLSKSGRVSASFSTSLCQVITPSSSARSDVFSTKICTLCNIQFRCHSICAEDMNLMSHLRLSIHHSHMLKQKAKTQSTHRVGVASNRSVLDHSVTDMSSHNASTSCDGSVASPADFSRSILDSALGELSEEELLRVNRDYIREATPLALVRMYIDNERLQILAERFKKRNLLRFQNTNEDLRERSLLRKQLTSANTSKFNRTIFLLVSKVNRLVRFDQFDMLDDCSYDILFENRVNCGPDHSKSVFNVHPYHSNLLETKLNNINWKSLDRCILQMVSIFDKTNLRHIDSFYKSQCNVSDNNTEDVQILQVFCTCLCKCVILYDAGKNIRNLNSSNERCFVGLVSLLSQFCESITSNILFQLLFIQLHPFCYHLVYVLYARVVSFADCWINEAGVIRFDTSVSGLTRFFGLLISNFKRDSCVDFSQTNYHTNQNSHTNIPSLLMNQSLIYLNNLCSYLICSSVLEWISALIKCISTRFTVDDKPILIDFLSSTLHMILPMTRFSDEHRSQPYCADLTDALFRTRILDIVPVLFTIITHGPPSCQHADRVMSQHTAVLETALSPLHHTSVVSNISLSTTATSQSSGNVGVACQLERATVCLAVLSFELLIDLARLNVVMYQEIVSCGGRSVEFCHLVHYLLAYCRVNISSYSSSHVSEYDQLLAYVIQAIGFFAVNCPSNQTYILSGCQPTLFDYLLNLPVEYFCHSDLVAILFPTLFAICSNSPDAVNLLSLEMNYENLIEFANSDIGKKSEIIQLLNGH